MSANTISDFDATAIIQRLKWPDVSLSREAAETLLQIQFHPSDLERMQELAQKARDGSLTNAEREESLQYDLVGHFMAILHSRARRALKKPS